jgi:small-conductance mechanosensitive channel
MENMTTLFDFQSWNPWVYTTLIFFVVLTVAMVLRVLIWSRLRSWAASTEAKWDDFVLDQVSAPLTLLLVVASFGIAGQSAPPVVRNHPLMVFGVKVSLIVIAVWVINRALTIFFRSTLLPEGLGATTRNLLTTITRVILFVLGVLIVLDTVGVSITPVLASLGVGSIAVALALQDTLSNFFGGLYIMADKPIRLGDFVKIGEVEGYVDKIGWRTTRIRRLSNHIVILPNSKVATAEVLNYDLPEPEGGLVVDVGVSYESDLEKVERVTVEVAKDVLQKVPGGVTSFQPFIRYKAFGESSIDFSVILRVKLHTDMFLMRHEFIKALHARFNLEKITIPFPQRTLHVASLPETFSVSAAPSSVRGTPGEL